MNAALNHIKRILEENKIKVILEDDSEQLNPTAFKKRAILFIESIETDQQATHFADDVSIRAEIQHDNASEALKLVETIRAQATSNLSTGVVGVVSTGLSIGENPYLEKVKSYKMNFKIKTITTR